MHASTRNGRRVRSVKTERSIRAGLKDAHANSFRHARNTCGVHQVPCERGLRAVVLLTSSTVQLQNARKYSKRAASEVSQDRTINSCRTVERTDERSRELLSTRTKRLRCAPGTVLAWLEGRGLLTFSIVQSQNARKYLECSLF